MITVSTLSSAPGYRRRILIEPRPGRVTAELEDDYHRMTVALDHAEGIVTNVESQMKRAPWTGCIGAMNRIRETFVGTLLVECARRGERATNCTHLHDLAVFGAAHAGDPEEAVAYEVHCDDGDASGNRRARLWRNGTLLLDWTLAGMVLVAPSGLAGRALRDLGELISSADRDRAEAMRILRWAAIVASGRGMDIPAGLSATRFPEGSCFNFQADIAAGSLRVPDADYDFSMDRSEPMADRGAYFPELAGAARET